jgi:phosphoglycolate phosphatase-like HAD superfamily hydrolase
MARRPPTILVLDFDGVLCDGMREYFGASWRTYERLWGAPSMSADDLFPCFSRLRPVVETGWEMPVVLRALMAGKAETDLLRGWDAKQHVDAGVTREQLGQTLDRVREEWIRDDQAGWLASHRFYPGVIARVRKAADAGVHVVIATTKEGKFARLLVESQGLKLPAAQVLGKEVRRPKQQVLREALAQARERGVAQPVAWFVEDRLGTLRSVTTQADLADVGLFLASWGYNLPADREAARADGHVRLLDLESFTADFADWP